jgi:hypothetical protein
MNINDYKKNLILFRFQPNSNTKKITIINHMSK